MTRSLVGPLLAASAGAADVVAFFGLGNAFGGIVTGNLVTAGYGLAAGKASLAIPPITAIAGCVAGEIAWARALRPGTATRLLLGELALFLLVLIGWLAAGSRPTGADALVLLALLSVGLGGQSIWALRIHQTTTYFTGMLTHTVSALAGDSPASAAAGTSIRQLSALLAGALLAGVVLRNLRPAAAAVPLLLLASAVGVHLCAGTRHRAQPTPVP